MGETVNNKTEPVITVNHVLSGTVFVLITLVAFSAWHMSALYGRVNTLEKNEIEIKAAYEKANAELKARVEANEAKTSEQGTKLDRALTILERIDKKLGQP